MKGKRKKTWRGQRNKNSMQKFVVMLNNVRGAKSKQDAIKRIMQEHSPVMLALVETKLRDGEPFEIEGYNIIRVDRRGEGGGVLIGYKNKLNNMVTVVRKEREDCEIVWVKLDNKKVRARIGVVYMPQENVPLRIIKRIYDTIMEEIEEAIQQGEKLILLGDLNCKIGEEIEGNKPEVSKGGKVLLQMVKKYNLVIVNKTEKCKGLWTREENGQQSVVDYMIIRKEHEADVDEMAIDEHKELTPYRMEGENIIYTDHHMISTTFNMYYSEKARMQQKYISSRGYKKFKSKIREEKISEELTKKNFNRSYDIWSNKVLQIVDKYSETRKKKSQWKVNRHLMKAKKMVNRELRCQNLSDEKVKILKTRKKLLIQYIEEEDKKRSHNKVTKQVAEIKKEGGLNSTAFWEMKRRVMGRPHEAGHAIVDEEGNRFEEPEEIKEQHAKYYEQLLQSGKEDAVGYGIEEMISIAINSIQTLAENTKPRKITEEEVEKVVAKLKKKKAKDKDGWKNEMMLEGGDEMIKSLVKLCTITYGSLKPPKKWDEVIIKSTHKKGSKLLMKNKRGLFMTNLISKVFERILKNRNKDVLTRKLSPMQTGGVEKRSTIDNILTVLAIMERNTYYGKETYITFADVQKCFDRMWVDDGVKDMWLKGMDSRDCIMVRNMNRSAVAVIDTPVGVTREIKVKHTLKQGTVIGPDVCKISMDSINNRSIPIITAYGPDLDIQGLAFMDDVVSAGSNICAEKTVESCSILEDRKKMIFGTSSGKSAHMVANGKEKAGIVEKVKNGWFERVEEYKLLGVWLDPSGKYQINIDKNFNRIVYMVTTVKVIANQKTMGIMTTISRLYLVEIIVLPTILYGIEAWAVITKKEMCDLERMLGKILRQVLELPTSTSYEFVIMETGMWKMRARIAYKKLMLYQNILKSDSKRLVKRILLAQMERDRKGTWYREIVKIMTKYNIADKAKEMTKSAWKKTVKERINETEKELLKEECRGKTKCRTVVDDAYTMKGYLKESGMETGKSILKARSHMVKLPANYKSINEDAMCVLCGKEEGTTEHVFSCERTKYLQKTWNTKEKHLRSQNKQELQRAAMFLQAVETLMGLNMER